MERQGQVFREAGGCDEQRGLLGSRSKYNLSAGSGHILSSIFLGGPQSMSRSVAPPVGPIPTSPNTELTGLNELPIGCQGVSALPAPFSKSSRAFIHLLQ
jgi:hypothetical protein